ncbi:carbohydrate ABC transporter permease [Paenibacillus sp. BC26]|uniref:carbohydrate ABC transporter permease n=1 Tax=Paenibacillus sp. BC26 TaxID=1881032 RepID=UPI0008E61F90|nr:carbohydrate ABC transporter permease [Paenibacillus sp. BC26]SFS45600.1 putative aldouronate transport system permease protein [Paenibacillus sp. BC26]
MKQPILFKLSVNTIFLIYSALCVIPLLVVLSISLSDEESIFRTGYHILPVDFSFQAYEYILFGSSPILQAYGVTTIATLAGTILHLILSSMLAYGLSRKEVKYRHIVAFLVVFCMLFSGGLVPWYILITKYLHLKNTLFVLFVPYLVSSINVLIMRNFFIGIPDSIIESARIDGSGEFNTFIKMVVPLSTPVFATIGLMTAVFFWNDWFTSALFIEDGRLYSLQYLLQSIMNNIAYLQGTAFGEKMAVTIPSETARMATCIMAVGPIVVAYPLLQRYFVKGLTLGAVKA